MNWTLVRIKLLGWLLITYGFFLLLLPAIIAIAVLLLEFPPEEPSSNPFPALSYPILRAFGVPIFLIYSYSIIALLIVILVPIGALIAGIAILKFKKWSRDFGLTVFSLSIFFKVILLLIIFSDSYLMRVICLQESGFSSFCWYFAVDISIAFYLSRPRVKQSFEQLNEVKV